MQELKAAQTADAESPAASPEWTRIILPERGLFDFQLGELWRYRDLIWQLARRDLAGTYKQTLLGPAWFVVQPLLTTVVFSFLFGRMAGFGTEHVPHFLFYMGGLVPWGFFAECVNKTSHTFTRNASIFGKVYFPRMVVPVAHILLGLFGFAIQLAIFLVGLGIYLWQGAAIQPNGWIIAVPLLLLQCAMLGTGVGCMVAALTTRFRDLGIGVGFGVQLWMYGSSIVFPLSQVDPELRWIMQLNPMVPVIEAFRFVFLGVGDVERWHLYRSFAMSAVVLFGGLFMFQRAEQRAMDSV